MNKCVKNSRLLLFLIKSFLLRTCCLGRQSMSGSQLRQESWRREVMICMPKKPSSITLFLAMVQLSWFKIKTVSFHPSPEWQSWSSHNLSLLEVTQEGRIQASSQMAGKKNLRCLFLSYATLKIPDILQRVFHHVCWSNGYGCTERTEHGHIGNRKTIRFSIPAVVLIKFNMPPFNFKRAQKYLKFHPCF